MWCPNCKTEYREGVTVCADCGAALVDKEQESTFDVCELSGADTAEKVLEYLAYSGVQGAKKEQMGGDSFKITVPSEEAKKAEKMFRGYLLAKQEEKEEDASEETAEEKEDAASFAEETEEDAADLLYSGGKKEYVRCSDKYNDLKFSGITFIVFGILGIIYLTLSKLEVIPINYNVVIFWIIAALFAAFIITGIVSMVHASKIRLKIPQEEEEIEEMNDWLDQNLTKEMVAGWRDSEVTEGENDLFVTARIYGMLSGQYADKPQEMLEAIADEYYEAHYVEKAEK